MNSHEDGNQEGTPFNTLYPAIKGYWGLHRIPETPPNWMHASSREEIERQLREVKQVHEVPIGNELAKYVAKWAVYRKPKGMSAATDDWEVGFFKSAIAGRVPQFLQWAIDHPSPYSDLALAGVRMIYDFQWPHNATAGYVFYALWGWLQLELRKPGEKKLATIAEQKAFLTSDAERRGEKVVGWYSLGGGGIMAVTEPKDKGEQSPARAVTASQPNTSRMYSDSEIGYFEVDDFRGRLSAAGFRNIYAGQDEAYRFFLLVPFDDLKTLGVVVVEGLCPGDDYCAAELCGDIKAANRAAEAAGIPVRFRKRRKVSSRPRIRVSEKC